MTEVSIRGLSKVAVLAVLFNNAVRSEESPIAPQDRRNLTVRQARTLWRTGDVVQRSRTGIPWRRHVRFDYVGGRPLKVIFRGNMLETTAYDLNHGSGSAAVVIDQLRRTGSTSYLRS